MADGKLSFPRLLLNLSCLVLAAALLAGCGGKDTSWRKGGVPGSRPYTVRGKTYYPLKSAHGFVEEGVASWYGPGFHGKRTASGERFNQYNISAAHKILPLGTEVRVTNLENHRSLILHINDRGPFVDDRVIDLSRGAAQRLGVIGKGTARVRIQSLGDVPQVEDGDVVLGTFFVQIGAFSKKENALGLIERLTGSGHKGRMIYGSNNLWNVQVGPWEDSRKADEMMRVLRALYPHAFVVGDGGAS